MCKIFVIIHIQCILMYVWSKTLCTYFHLLQEDVSTDYDATDCLDAGTSFFADDGVCLENYRSLYDSSSTQEFTIASQSLCASQSCRNRLGDFVNYLRECDDLGSDSVCMH